MSHPSMRRNLTFVLLFLALAGPLCVLGVLSPSAPVAAVEAVAGGPVAEPTGWPAVLDLVLKAVCLFVAWSIHPRCPYAPADAPREDRPTFP